MVYVSGQETVHLNLYFASKNKLAIIAQSQSRERKLKCHLYKSTETDMSFWEQSSQHKSHEI